MLELEELRRWVEEILNIQLSTYIENKQDTLLKRDRYEFAFRVYTDIGEHKGYDYIDYKGDISVQPTNKIRRYIEAEMLQIDSSVEATDYTNIVRNTELTILVPLNDIELLDERNIVVEEIRNIIEDTFKNNYPYTSNGLQEEPFSVKCSLASSGDRESRALVGDSVTLTAYLNFYYVESGIYSSSFKLMIDGTEIIPIRMGVSRALTQETNTYSNDTRAVAMNTPTSSVLTINFDVVCRNNRIYADMYRYAVAGKTLDKDNVLKPKVAHAVEIAYPQYGSPLTTKLLMNFDTINISTQLPLIASMSVTLTETKYINGLTNLSAYASQHLNEIVAEQE